MNDTCSTECINCVHSFVFDNILPYCFDTLTFVREINITYFTYDLFKDIILLLLAFVTIIKPLVTKKNKPFKESVYVLHQAKLAVLSFKGHDIHGMPKKDLSKLMNREWNVLSTKCQNDWVEKVYCCF